MPSIEQRLGEVEERVSDQAQAIVDVRDTLLAAFGELRVQQAADFATLRSDIREVRAETMRRFEQVDRRFEQVDRRFEQLDVRFTQVDARFVQMDSRFIWLVGFQFAVLLAVVSALLGAYYR